jgi:hypothetical protein
MGDADGKRITANQALLVPLGPLASGYVAFGNVRVASGTDWDTADPDFSEAAHAERVAKVGTDASYHVVARFD